MSHNNSFSQPGNIDTQPLNRESYIGARALFPGPKARHCPRPPISHFFLMAKNDPLFKGTPQSVQDLRKSAKRRERDKKRAAFFKAVTKGEQ